MLRSLLLIACAALMSTSTLLADVTGSILGTVTDPSAAVIQGVHVTATNIDTNQITDTRVFRCVQPRSVQQPERLLGGHHIRVDYERASGPAHRPGRREVHFLS
jgi:hypothetical protein